MSKVINVSRGNILLKVDSANSIILDTGPQVGLVSVTGNLSVAGRFASSGNLVTNNSFVQINANESGSGITAPGSIAGVEIDRGSKPNAQIVFNDSALGFDPVSLTDTTGVFALRTVSALGVAQPSTLQVGTVAIDASTPTNLNLDLRYSNKAVQIVNSLGYENLLLPIDDSTKDNLVPNRKFVTSYVDNIIASGAATTNINANNVTAGILPIIHGGTGAASASDARVSLGLGTAATLSVQTDPNDSTSGRLLTNGAWGWGKQGSWSASQTVGSGISVNTITVTGLYVVDPAALNQPVASTAGWLLVDGSNSATYVAQTFVSNTTTPRRYFRTQVNGVWSAWAEVYSTGNLSSYMQGFLSNTTAAGAVSSLGLSNSSNITASSANTPNTIVLRDSSGNFSAGTITAALTGNASTATKLQTARLINGVSFDGSVDITVTDSTKLPLTGGSLTGSLTLKNTLTVNSTTTNPAIEIGRTDGTASTPYIDFHSGSTLTDYDARIIATGGTGAVGQGTLTYNGSSHIFNGPAITQNSADMASPSDSTALQVSSDSSHSAFVTFKRMGAYAINLGLDVDNVFKIGGYSDGAVYRLQVDSSGTVTARGSFVTPSWLETTNNTGWKNNTYGGGWFMQDTTWIRAFNGKSVYTAATMQADAGFVGPGGSITSLNANNISSGTLSVARGGTGTSSSTGSGNVVLSDSPALTGVPTAPTAAPGTISDQLATTAYVQSIVNDTRLSTAWVNFFGGDDGAGAPPYIRASYNVSSVTDNGTGDYTVNFATAMNTNTYSAVVSAIQGDSPSGTYSVGIKSSTPRPTGAPVQYSISGFQVLCQGSGGINFDSYTVTASVFGGK